MSTSFVPCNQSATRLLDLSLIATHHSSPIPRTRRIGSRHEDLTPAVRLRKFPAARKQGNEPPERAGECFQRCRGFALRARQDPKPNPRSFGGKKRNQRRENASHLVGYIVPRCKQAEISLGEHRRIVFAHGWVLSGFVSPRIVGSSLADPAHWASRSLARSGAFRGGGGTGRSQQRQNAHANSQSRSGMRIHGVPWRLCVRPFRANQHRVSPSQAFVWHPFRRRP